MLELSPIITRQYIDAVAVFDARAEATEEAAQVRGGMYWHAGPASSPQAQYLVRTSPAGAETSLGPRTPETQAIYDKFMQRHLVAHVHTSNSSQHFHGDHLAFSLPNI